MAKLPPSDFYQTGQINPNSQKFAITGMSETLKLFEELKVEFGDSKKTSKVLIDAVKQALSPVLSMAKMLAPKGETHLLANSLTIVGRRPTNRDKKSRYINNSDTVIGLVTTKSIPQKLKKKFSSSNDSLISDYANSKRGSEFRKITYKEIKKKKKKFYAGFGMAWDARAPANEWGTKTEFGSAHTPASPFMRPAMESKGQAAANELGKILKQKIEQYRSKNAK